MSPSKREHPKVFISYSHDSPSHGDRVLDLALRLRADGIDCDLDQFEVSPPQGWPRWMEDRIVDSDYILVICTEAYCHRLTQTSEHEGPATGLGRLWEAHLIWQHIYNARTLNTKFIPVLFESDDVRHVPLLLQAVTHYRLDSLEGYGELYRHLTDQPKVRRGTLGALRPLPPRQRKQDFLSAPWNIRTAFEDHVRSLLERDDLIHPRGLTSVGDFFKKAMDTKPVPLRHTRLCRVSTYDDHGWHDTSLSELIDRKTPARHVLLLGAPGHGKTATMLQSFWSFQQQDQFIPCWLDGRTAAGWKPLAERRERPEELLKDSLVELITKSCFGIVVGNSWRKTVQDMLECGSGLLLFCDDVDLWPSSNACAELFNLVSQDTRILRNHRLVLSVTAWGPQLPPLAKMISEGGYRHNWKFLRVTIDPARVKRLVSTFAARDRSGGRLRQSLACRHLMFLSVPPLEADSKELAFAKLLETYESRYAGGSTPEECLRSQLVRFEVCFLKYLAAFGPRALGPAPWSDQALQELLKLLQGILRLHYGDDTIQSWWPARGDGAAVSIAEVMARCLSTSPFLQVMEE